MTASKSLHLEQTTAFLGVNVEYNMVLQAHKDAVNKIMSGTPYPVETKRSKPKAETSITEEEKVMIHGNDLAPRP